MGFTIKGVAYGRDNTKMRIEYDGSNAKYIGYALPGTAESANEWFIQYCEYDGNNLILRVSAQNVAWDNRATVYYT